MVGMLVWQNRSRSEVSIKQQWENGKYHRFATASEQGNKGIPTR